MAQASRRDISFKTVDQLTLRGWLFPVGEKSPLVILSHGVGFPYLPLSLRGRRLIIHMPFS